MDKVSLVVITDHLNNQTVRKTCKYYEIPKIYYFWEHRHNVSVEFFPRLVRDSLS